MSNAFGLLALIVGIAIGVQIDPLSDLLGETADPPAGDEVTDAYVDTLNYSLDLCRDMHAELLDMTWQCVTSLAECRGLPVPVRSSR